MVGLVVLLLLAVALVVKNSRDEAEALASRQDTIEDFTDDVNSLLQGISPVTSEMVTANADTKKLADKADTWGRVLQEAQTELTATGAAASPELDLVNRMLFQAVLQYSAAAETFKLIPDAQGKLRASILERATAQVAAADGTWESAIGLLDRQRIEAELDPSRLRVPSRTTTPTTPSTVPSIPSG